MTRILYLLNDASEYVFPSVPFKENTGALAPMGRVGCSSIAVAIEAFIKTKMKRTTNRMGIFFGKGREFWGNENCRSYAKMTKLLEDFYFVR